MKHRSGFVSNSSSSSFIVAVDSNADVPTLTLEVDFARYGKKITTKKELDDYIIGYYGCRGDTLESLLENEGEYVQERYESMLNAISNGKVVYAGSASYNETDDPIEMMIGNGGLEHFSNIEIIEDGN